MTKAKITKQDGYQCAPDGATVRTFSFGEVVTGQVAAWALADHAAQRMMDPRTDTQAGVALEVKDKPKKRGRHAKKDKPE